MSDKKSEAAKGAQKEEEVKSSPAHASSPPYFAIFVLLAVLTVVEIYIAGLSLNKADIVALLMVFATAKAMLVVLYYMHLRYETYALKLVAIVPLAIALMFIIVLIV